MHKKFHFILQLRDLSADFATQIQSVHLNDSLGEQVSSI